MTGRRQSAKARIADGGRRQARQPPMTPINEETKIVASMDRSAREMALGSSRFFLLNRWNAILFLGSRVDNSFDLNAGHAGIQQSFFQASQSAVTERLASEVTQS